MEIKLEFVEESKKAYKLLNGSWIPKSVLDERGLKHPYYRIKDWWFEIQVTNIRLPLKELQELDRKVKPTLDTKKNSERILRGIQPMVIKFRDIPPDVLKIWKNYWSGYGDFTPDYEPRMWGNDCFEGDPTDRF